MGGTSSSSTGRTAAVRTDSFTVSIPKALGCEVAQAAKELGTTKAKLVREAVARMLDDMHDNQTIEKRRNEPTIKHDDFWKKVGLEG